MSTELIVVRHGETHWNVEGRIQGYSADSPLTERGHAQARALGARLKTESIEVLYSSDLGRTRQTAQPLIDATGLEAEFDATLRERNYGVFEGRTYGEIEREFPEAWARFTSRDPQFAAPGGESSAQFQARVVAAFEDGVLQHIAGRLARGEAVFHGPRLEACLHVAAQFQPFPVRQPETAGHGVHRQAGEEAAVEIDAVLAADAGDQFGDQRVDHLGAPPAFGHRRLEEGLQDIAVTAVADTVEAEDGLAEFIRRAHVVIDVRPEIVLAGEHLAHRLEAEHRVIGPARIIEAAAVHFGRQAHAFGKRAFQHRAPFERRLPGRPGVLDDAAARRGFAFDLEEFLVFGKIAGQLAVHRHRSSAASAHLRGRISMPGPSPANCTSANRIHPVSGSR